MSTNAMETTMDDYASFLAQKQVTCEPSGFAVGKSDLNPALFPFQRDIVAWALRRGRAAIFADCGLGKTPMQLEWAHRVVLETGGRVLIVAPLAVSQQTCREGEKFGIAVRYARDQSQVANGITITNYEMLDRFDSGAFSGVVLDESSILKAHDGKTRTAIIESFQQTPFRLACTATPAPNDFMELANHSEFVGAMTRSEMLSMFFVHDGGSTQDWRVKGHAESDFWRWVCSWAVMMRKPSDLGYPDGGFILPPLTVHQVVVEVGTAPDGQLFPVEAATLQERLAARRDSVDARVEKCAQIVNSTPGPWVVWCGLNSESEALAAAIDGAVEVTGSDSLDEKERRILTFSAGASRVMVTKPKIAGHGMNWQHCANVAFVGLSDSWEQYYQAVRRVYRFGQDNPVNVYLITSDSEGAVVSNIQRKEADAARMAAAMVEHMHVINEDSLRGVSRTESTHEREVATGRDWTVHLGDCVEVVREIPSDSLHYSVFSPPFASLYTYSNMDRDMGNCPDTESFFEHFAFLIGDLHRVIMPGRLLSVHCMNLQTLKARDGVIGIRDFRGDIIRAFESVGFIYHSEVCIWKDPVTAMQRTKALGLLHKQIKKDSCMSRQGIPDYLVTFRKAGDNPERVTHTNESFPVDLWQRYASPVWMDINATETLQRESAREDADERHICPLQLEVIRRAIRLWTNPGDVVLSPFAGIGSEGYVAIQEGRKFLGAELKRSYWTQACANLRAAQSASRTLFDEPTP